MKIPGAPSIYTKEDLCHEHAPNGECAQPDYLPAQLQPYWQCSLCKKHFCSESIELAGGLLRCKPCLGP